MFLDKKRRLYLTRESSEYCEPRRCERRVCEVCMLLFAVAGALYLEIPPSARKLGTSPSGAFLSIENPHIVDSNYSISYVGDFYCVRLR